MINNNTFRTVFSVLMVAVALFLPLGLSARGAQEQDNSAAGRSTAAEASATGQANAEAHGDMGTAAPAADSGVLDLTSSMDEVLEIRVESNGLNYSPREIRVKNGARIRLTYVNNMGTHDWVIDEFNARTAIFGSGNQETIEFTVDQVGSFEYYCSVPGHRQRGMFGTLVVVE